MWLITEDGFYSVIAYNPKADRKSNSVFKSIAKGPNTHVLVRCRVKQHLEALRRVMPNLVIDDQSSADYRYRAVMPRRKWKGYLNQMTDAIDYEGHYKEVVRDAQPKELRQPMYSAMMSVWSIFAKLQPGGAYGYSGKTRSSYYSAGKGTSTTSKLDDVLADDDWWARYDQQDTLDADAGEPIDLKALRELIDSKNTTELTQSEVYRLDDDAFDVWDAIGPDSSVPVKVVLDYIDGELREQAQDAADGEEIS
jgi:hypothetical protein